MVCGKCSQYRWVLPAQGPDKLRICRDCHNLLRTQQEEDKKTADAANDYAADTTNNLDLSPQQIPIFAPPSKRSTAFKVAFKMEAEYLRLFCNQIFMRHR